MTSALEQIAWAVLPEKALVAKLAAEARKIDTQSRRDVRVSTAQDLARRLPRGERGRLSKAILLESKRQIRVVGARYNKRDHSTDYYECPRGHYSRRQRIMKYLRHTHCSERTRIRIINSQVVAIYFNYGGGGYFTAEVIFNDASIDIKHSFKDGEEAYSYLSKLTQSLKARWFKKNTFGLIKYYGG